MMGAVVHENHGFVFFPYPLVNENVQQAVS